MHIQEGTNTTLTTCSKMTEEVDRRHGVNGHSSSKEIDEASGQNTANSASGGRLKFFKDGKFILELVRGSVREGERPGWVSVPRKTFWPPAGNTAAHTAHLPHPHPHPPRGERAASLSVSDDNSSIQSSPWQRDHCWKQTAPRRNISKELTMFYCRPSTLSTNVIAAGGRRRRRRPLDPAPDRSAPDRPARNLTNGVADGKRNGDAAEDCVDGDERRYSPDAEKYHMKLKKPYQYHKLRVYKKCGPPARRKELSAVVTSLRERAATLPAPAPVPPPAPGPVYAKLASCRQLQHEHAMVSPRKRILRELERVTLDDQQAAGGGGGTKRRAKTVPALSTASYPPSPGPSRVPHPAPASAPAPAPSPAGSGKHVGSYSIHSLLSMSDESPRRSPHAPSPAAVASRRTDSPRSAPSPDLSPSPDSYRYRYALLGSPGSCGAGVGGAARDSPPSYRSYPSSPYSRAALVAAAREDLPYMYGYAGYLPPPPLYHRAAPAPPPPTAAPLYYYSLPPGPWAPLQHPLPLLTDRVPKEEPTSDLPLNLSKH